MRRKTKIAIALTIAGSDSGGGAGIQADLKTFAALGVHGTSVITCVTAQNPVKVIRVQPCSPELVISQLEAVFEELRPKAIKTGMLYSKAIVRTVARFLRPHKDVPLVVDPVMISTSGARLARRDAIQTMRHELFPLAALVTPNLEEASFLVGEKVKSVEGMRSAAKEFQRRFGCAVLVKGGHLPGLKQAVDVFYDGTEELLLSAPFVRGVRTHGTGCAYSAAMTAYLARGLPMTKAIALAKENVTRAISGSRAAGRHWVLGF